MKIVSVDIFLLDGGSPGWRPIVCRVNTDEGVSGYGEASVGFDTGASASYSMIKEVAPFVIGMDPMATEAVWNKDQYLVQSRFRPLRTRVCSVVPVSITRRQD